MKFELNQENLKNLQTFLQRVQLKGSEVQAFNNLVGALQKPIVEEKKEVKK